MKGADWLRDTDVVLEVADDFLIFRRNNKNEKRFCSCCPTCGVSKGYQKKQYVGKDCHSCNSKKMGVIGANWNNKSDIVLDKIRVARQQQKIIHSQDTKDKISVSNKNTKRKQFLDNNGFCMSNAHRKLRHKVSGLMNCYLKRRLAKNTTGSKIKELPYTVDELKKHLESKFQEGMSWNNYGKGGWHIDHIKPDSLFQYNSVEDAGFQESWALSNLQPMWEIDNLKKGNKYVI